MKRKLTYILAVVVMLGLFFTGCSREYSNKPLPVHETRPSPERIE